MKVKFGMFMTDAVGKSGGQCIQRFRGQSIVRNISQPINNFLRQTNPQKKIISILSYMWSMMNPTKQQIWNTIGLAMKGKTVFGDEKSYTGREAFFKLQGPLTSFSQNELDPNDVDLITPICLVSEIGIAVDDTQIGFNNINLQDCLFIEMRAARATKSQNYVTPEKLKTFVRAADLSDTTLLYFGLINTIGEVLIGQFVFIALRGISSSGVASDWFIQKVQASSGF